MNLSSNADPPRSVPLPDELAPYGWNARWAELLAEHPGCYPGRVTRHDGSAVHLATSEGVVVVPLVRRLEPAPAVGDWVACEGKEPVAVLPRASVLRRRAADRDTDQVLAANVDIVFLVCGLDRVVKTGRIDRGATLARDAGAVPIVVLTKAAVAEADAASVAAAVAAASPGIEVLITSAREGIGLDALRALARDQTVTMLGESGAGKSSLVNALLGEDVAATGEVREGDSKGRHTTTSRDMHVLPTGGVLIDTPGIRGVGLWVEPEAVAETFTDIDDLAAECRFADCGHDTEPGCAVTDAIADGRLTATRLAAWRALHDEAQASPNVAVSYEQARKDKELARNTKAAERRKGR
ncbi:MAG: ribosome small subunit-dependent GTPase A [Acidimicrobiia bacterium]